MQGQTHTALDDKTRGWKGLRNLAMRLYKHCNESNHRTPWRGIAHLQYRIKLILSKLTYVRTLLSKYNCNLPFYCVSRILWLLLLSQVLCGQCFMVDTVFFFFVFFNLALKTG